MPRKTFEERQQYQAEWYRKNKDKQKASFDIRMQARRDYIKEYKESLGCADCGNDFPHYVLEFDHLPEFTKVRNISQVQEFSSMEKLMEEIEKCEVVCANCHRRRTFNRRQ
jgi:formate-dependent nitrite reductase cytochrome c552 subunit